MVKRENKRIWVLRGMRAQRREKNCDEWDINRRQ